MLRVVYNSNSFDDSATVILPMSHNTINVSRGQWTKWNSQRHPYKLYEHGTSLAQHTHRVKMETKFDLQRYNNALVAGVFIVSIWYCCTTECLRASNANIWKSLKVDSVVFAFLTTLKRLQFKIHFFFSAAAVLPEWKGKMAQQNDAYLKRNGKTNGKC